MDSCTLAQRKILSKKRRKEKKKVKKHTSWVYRKVFLFFLLAPCQQPARPPLRSGRFAATTTYTPQWHSGKVACCYIIYNEGVGGVVYILLHIYITSVQRAANTGPRLSAGWFLYLAGVIKSPCTAPHWPLGIPALPFFVVSWIQSR